MYNLCWLLKLALSFPIKTMKLPACDLILHVSKFCFEEWQDIWNYCAGKKLHAIYPVVDIAQQSTYKNSFLPWGGGH